MTAAQVIAGERSWSGEAGDNLSWLQALPAYCCSLMVTSPPYEAARTYGVEFKLRGQQWVDFMIPRVVEMCRVTRGLVCINMAGQVRDHSYQPVVEWLVADLTRYHGIVCGPAPYVYFRYSIPGSGGARYHRRDWEPVYCFCRPDVLPLAWSDNTAMGLAARWAPGGAMSNRMSNGSRVNQWGTHVDEEGTVSKGGQDGASGKRAGRVPLRPSHKVFGPAPDGTVKGSHARDIVKPRQRQPGEKAHMTCMDANGERRDEQYTESAIANPGNVVREMYDAEMVRQLLSGGDVNGEVVEGSAGGDVIRCIVGGGSMSRSDLAHQNEAPFSEKLAEFLIRSYAPPESIVGDPFCGSGTVPVVALRHGRRAIVCDLRESQVDLTRRRMVDELGMFAET